MRAVAKGKVLRRCGSELLTPALSSFGEERENYFVGRLPGVARLHRIPARQPPLGQVSFRLRQTSGRSFESAFTRRACTRRGRSASICG
jgi:hypothetical protein